MFGWLFCPTSEAVSLLLAGVLLHRHITCTPCCATAVLKLTMRAATYRPMTSAMTSTAWSITWAFSRCGRHQSAVCLVAARPLKPRPVWHALCAW